MVARSARDANAATQAYEDFKREHLNTQLLCQQEGITFIPLIAEAGGGGWGPEAHKVFNELAKLTSSMTGGLGVLWHPAVSVLDPASGKRQGDPTPAPLLR